VGNVVFISAADAEYKRLLARFLELGMAKTCFAVGTLPK
jgi:hypothetical protein